MESVSFTPKGGDGANAEDQYHIAEAIETFRAMAAAIVDDQSELASVLWEHFVLRVGDDVNPFGAFVQAGIITTATAIRTLAGDKNPSGPPTMNVEITAVVWDRVDNTVVEMEEADVAAAVISHACNWEWDKLNELMSSKVEGMTDDSFLQQLGIVIMSMFVGVGGLESAERAG